MGVLKCNATGHGSVQLGKKLEEFGAKHLAVATLIEAVQLRRGHITIPILVFGGYFIGALSTQLKNITNLVHVDTS